MAFAPFAAGFVESATPYLKEMVLEAKKKRLLAEQDAALQGALRTLYPESSPRKIAAYTTAHAHGINLPLKRLQERPDYDWMRDKQPEIDHLIEMAEAGEIEMSQVVNHFFNVEEQRQKDLTIEEVHWRAGELRQKHGENYAKWPAEPFFQYVRLMDTLYRGLGQTLIVRRLKAMGIGEDQPEFMQRQYQIMKIVGNKTFAELTERDRLALENLGISPDELKFAFDQEDMSLLDYTRVQNAIMLSYSQPRWMSDLSAAYQDWMMGQPTVMDSVLNERFDRNTGMLRPEYVKEVYDQIKVTLETANMPDHLKAAYLDLKQYLVTRDDLLKYFEKVRAEDHPTFTENEMQILLEHW